MARGRWGGGVGYGVGGVGLVVEVLVRSAQENHSDVHLCRALLLLLLGGLLLGGRGLGRLGGLGLGGGLGRGQGLLGGLLGGGLLLLLGVGGEGGRAAGNVDVLAVVGHVLQGELGAVAGAQAHRAGSQGGRGLTHFWWKGRQSGGWGKGH